MDLLVAVVIFGKTSSINIIDLLINLHIKFIILAPGDKPYILPTHIILSGGPKHVYENDHYPLDLWIIQNKIPVLGICYGMQLIAHTFGGKVSRMKEKEEGLIPVTEYINGMVVKNLRWMYRFDNVDQLPIFFTITGVTDKNQIASFTDNSKWWAVQYHPESIYCKDYSVITRFLLV